MFGQFYPASCDQCDALGQGTGLIMVIMLAGLRGIDEDIWKAARVDGIGPVKTYLRVIIPMMRPVFIRLHRTAFSTTMPVSSMTRMTSRSVVKPMRTNTGARMSSILPRWLPFWHRL